MCGIWAFLLKNGLTSVDLYKAFMKIQNRGPDRSNFMQINNNFIGFHRLAIMDKSVKGDQPFIYVDNRQTTNSTYMICNGEIYNYKEIIAKEGFTMNSSSDCEVILFLYKRYGFPNLLFHLIGEFAFIIFDINGDNTTIYGARDQFGVRPLFYGQDGLNIGFSSELKGLSDIMNTVKPFPPGHYFKYENNYLMLTEYYSFNYLIQKNKPEFNDTVKMLEKCVTCRLHSERPLGALLSGGLDSSLIVAIASRYLQKQGKKLKTFSIGMPGATDAKYAQMVADFCHTDHTHIELKKSDFLNAIDDVILAIETFDITTIRASVGQYLISKWIKENTDIKVLLIGDGSDELCSGYMYFHKAPSPNDSHYENAKLLKEIYLFDALRADRGIASNGLEARVPFLDYRFVDFYMSIDPALRIPIKGVEKWFLRKSFEHTNYLPEEVLFRKKEAFSDGVSGLEDSWFLTIQRMTDNMYSDEFLLKKQKEFTHCPPPNKEALHYRLKFNEMFGQNGSKQNVMPHFWLPNWCGDIKEPSARVLDSYQS